jgi:hypothetical protein
VAESAVAVDPALRWQFELVWSLLELHLTDLTDADCTWQPAQPCWTVRPDPAGVWWADFAEQEPDPIPATSVGWVLWHIGWWWSSALDGLAGVAAKPATEVPWVGSAAASVAQLRELRTSWLSRVDRLTAAELAEPAGFPWNGRADRTVAHLVAWVNGELMKNAAELGQLRLLHHLVIRELSTGGD